MADSASRLLRVFLCHSSSDKPIVRELYRRLDAEGWIDLWLDVEKLLPGQEWDIEIEKGVEQADVVLVFLSSQSVDKEGYIQKELRFVLNIADEKPEGTIFVIPLRLDDCIVPRRLRNWQYVDYFPKGQRKIAYRRLLESCKMRAARLGISTLKVTEEQAQREIEENTQKANQLQKLAPDFRVRQRDYLLEISRALTQELDLEKLLARILKIAIEMLAGQAGIILLKDDNWRVAAAHGIAPAFLDYLVPLLAEENVRALDVTGINQMMKELISTSSTGKLNGTPLPLAAHSQIIGAIFIFRNYSDVFSENDRSLLQAFADQAAIAVFNARLYGQISYYLKNAPKEGTEKSETDSNQA